ncbi:MAG: Bax inhibitor-1/YccA family protein [Pirellulaceae bacterium]
MSSMDQNPYAATYGASTFAAEAGESERTTFIRRTYAHLAGAVFAFMAIEIVIFNMVPEQSLQDLTRRMMAGYSWLIVLGAFMVVSMVADRWARSATSLAMQYAGLGLYVVAEAVIFVPLLLIAQQLGRAQGENIIASAGIMTAVIFGGLTVLVFFTRADFSWLGRYLSVAALAVLGIIVCSLLFNFNLGNLFTGAMVAFAAAYILYYTSNVLHHYRLDQHVAASLALFASVALLFWYVLQLFMSRD